MSEKQRTSGGTGLEEKLRALKNVYPIGDTEWRDEHTAVRLNISDALLQSIKDDVEHGGSREDVERVVVEIVGNIGEQLEKDNGDKKAAGLLPTLIDAFRDYYLLVESRRERISFMEEVVEETQHGMSKILKETGKSLAEDLPTKLRDIGTKGLATAAGTLINPTALATSAAKRAVNAGANQIISNWKDRNVGIYRAERKNRDEEDNLRRAENKCYDTMRQITEKCGEVWLLFRALGKYVRYADLDSNSRYALLNTLALFSKAFSFTRHIQVHEDDFLVQNADGTLEDSGKTIEKLRDMYIYSIVSALVEKGGFDREITSGSDDYVAGRIFLDLMNPPDNKKYAEERKREFYRFAHDLSSKYCAGYTRETLDHERYELHRRIYTDDERKKREGELARTEKWITNAENAGERLYLSVQDEYYEKVQKEKMRGVGIREWGAATNLGVAKKLNADPLFTDVFPEGSGIKGMKERMLARDHNDKQRILEDLSKTIGSKEFKKALFEVWAHNSEAKSILKAYLGVETKTVLVANATNSYDVRTTMPLNGAFLRMDDKVKDARILVTTVLEDITDLDLSSNGLKALPEQIGNLARLERLNVSDNPFTSLPRGMGNLRNLKELSIDAEHRAKLPEWMRKLPPVKAVETIPINQMLPDQVVDNKQAFLEAPRLLAVTNALRGTSDKLLSKFSSAKETLSRHMDAAASRASSFKTSHSIHLTFPAKLSHAGAVFLRPVNAATPSEALRMASGTFPSKQAATVAALGIVSESAGALSLIPAGASTTALALTPLGFVAMAGALAWNSRIRSKLHKKALKAAADSDTSTGELDALAAAIEDVVRKPQGINKNKLFSRNPNARALSVPLFGNSGIKQEIALALISNPKLEKTTAKRFNEWIKKTSVTINRPLSFEDILKWAGRNKSGLTIASTAATGILVVPSAMLAVGVAEFMVLGYIIIFGVSLGLGTMIVEGVKRER